MKSAPIPIVALLGLAAASCNGGGNGDDGGSGTPTTPATYQVPVSDCPTGWSGLTVTTDSEIEVEYLDAMPACTNETTDAVYLKNNSDAVWTLSTNGGVSSPIDASWKEWSFVHAVASSRPGKNIVVPGAELTVNLPPNEVEWLLDLSLSIAWQGHEVVAEKIQAAGEAAPTAALARETRAGSALAVCTLAVAEYADTISDLEDADAPEVLLNGLGVGVAGSKCHAEAKAAGAVDDSGRSVQLADELASLRSQTTVLEKVQTKVGWAQKAERFGKFALKVFLRGRS
jgi:hypothetical protein